jgi:hypothetical protein
MKHLDPQVVIAMAPEFAAAESARADAIVEMDQGSSPAALRRHLLLAATHYERAAQRIPTEVKRG